MAKTLHDPVETILVWLPTGQEPTAETWATVDEPGGLAHRWLSLPDALYSIQQHQSNYPDQEPWLRHEGKQISPSQILVMIAEKDCPTSTHLSQHERLEERRILGSS